MENILLVDRRRGIFNMGGLSLVPSLVTLSPLPYTCKKEPLSWLVGYSHKRLWSLRFALSTLPFVLW